MPLIHGRQQPTDHQKRVLAALLALERRHSWEWWSRDDIGRVVDAGGYHQVIQLTTIGRLKEAGLVQTERASWPEAVAAVVRCNCACYHWGLTDSGRRLAESLRIHWSDTAMQRVDACGGHLRWPLRDEDEPPPGCDDPGDDDDGDLPSPAPPVPGGALRT